MCSVCQHKHKRHCYGYCHWLWYFVLLWKRAEYKKRFGFFYSSFRDPEVNGHYFSAAGKKALAWLIPGSPISSGKEARVLSRNL